MENRRKEQRYRVRSKGFVRLEGRKMNMQTENLSVGGARITLDRPLLEGAEVTLYLMLRQGTATSPLHLCMTGTVVWCNEDMDAGFQAGIAFSSPQRDALLLAGCIVAYPAI